MVMDQQHYFNQNYRLYIYVEIQIYSGIGTIIVSLQNQMLKIDN